MFAQIKAVVDLITPGILALKKYRSEREHKDAVLNVLRFYFILLDCVNDGEKLITEAGPNPVEKILSLGPVESATTLARWDSIIVRQGQRLSSLQNAIFGQNHLAVINPDLQKRISEVIGYKADRLVTLHGIGAALLFRRMFPIANTDDERARYISIMAGEEGDILDIARINFEISALRESLNQYRLVVEQVVTGSELLQLSNQARQETSCTDGL
jgi:hypothetical protein